MKYHCLILFSLIAFTVSRRWWGYPPPRFNGGYWPGFRPVYYYPYYFFYRNGDDAPESPEMYKLPDDLTEICKDEMKVDVCGFDKDKKVVRDFTSFCEAGHNETVDYVVCGKCPDKNAEGAVFEMPETDKLPTCEINGNDIDTDNNDLE